MASFNHSLIVILFYAFLRITSSVDAESLCPSIDCTCNQTLLSCSSSNAFPRLDAGIYNFETAEFRLSNVSSIPDEVFRVNIQTRFTIRNLMLDNNGIKSISRRAFAGLESVETLDLSYNQLDNLPDILLNPFRTSLKILKLRGNELTEISNGFLFSLDNLLELYIEDNLIEEFHSSLFSDFSGLGSLRNLALSRNKVTTVPGFLLQGLHSLENIALQGNLLESLPETIFEDNENLSSVQISSNRLTYLPRGLLSGLSELDNFDAGNNTLSSIPETLFSSNLKILHIDLQGNQISGLSRVVFKNLTHLLNLYLNNNRLSHLPGDVFRDLVSIKNIYLNNNHLAVLCETLFSANINLEHVYLHGNNFSSVDVCVIDECSNHVVNVDIAIDDNHAGSCECSLCGLENRDVVRTKSISCDHDRCYCTQDDMSCTGLSTFPTFYPGTYDTRTFSLTLCNLQQIPNHAFSQNGVYFNDLHRITISFSNLSGIAIDAFAKLPKLNTIQIHSTDITRIQHGQFTLAAAELVELSLSKNNISYLEPTAFYGFSKLNLLELSGNNITSLDMLLFSQMENLYYLYLDDNKLTELTSELLQSTSQLIDLVLDYNLLESIPEGLLANTFFLTRLTIAGNKIVSLPADLLHNTTTSLKSFDAYRNRLTIIPQNFFKMNTEIEEIFLAENFLIGLQEDTFQGLNRLSILLLNNNYLTHLPEHIFSDLTALTFVSLTNNNIVTLCPLLFANNENIVSVTLSGNIMAEYDVCVFGVCSSVNSIAIDIPSNNANLNSCSCATCVNRSSSEMCSSGTFNLDCSGVCHCPHGVECDPVLGHCLNLDDMVCAPGWMSWPECQTTCSAFTYGSPNCANQCHCAMDVSCDSVTGVCDQMSAPICETGWTNWPSCDQELKAESISLGVMAGGIVGAVLLIIIIISVILIVLCLRRGSSFDGGYLSRVDKKLPVNRTKSSSEEVYDELDETKMDKTSNSSPKRGESDRYEKPIIRKTHSISSDSSYQGHKDLTSSLIVIADGKGKSSQSDDEAYSVADETTPNGESANESMYLEVLSNEPIIGEKLYVNTGDDEKENDNNNDIVEHYDSDQDIDHDRSSKL